MKWLRANLAKLSGGSASRAAWILIVAHLVPGLVAWALWAFGLLPVFDDWRWIPVSIAVTFAVVVVLGMFIRFGVWGTPATFGRGTGEDYTQTFGLRTGIALGWLRWLVQLVLVFIVIVPTLMTWMNVRWWHLVGTDELDGLPDRAAAIPIPDNWTLTDTEASETGFPDFMMFSGPEGPEPEGYVEQTFEVPASYTFDDLKQWLESPEWESAPDGDAFGAIQREKCNNESTRCDVRLVPPSGEEPEYFIRAELDESSLDGKDREVEVRLIYRQYAEPDWNVSQETIDRGMAIPVPSDWTRYNVSAETTNNGEDFTQFYGVPESFTRDDLEAWLNGTEWTDPANGTLFGEIKVDSPCRETGSGDSRYLCSAIVVGTERTPTDESSDGPVESLSVSLTADQTVRVSLERNG